MNKHQQPIPPLHIGQNIRLWRQLKGMKQYALAHALGVDKARISDIENNKTDLCLSMINEIAAALQLQPAHLFTNPQQALQPDATPQADTGFAHFSFFVPPALAAIDFIFSNSFTLA